MKITIKTEKHKKTKTQHIEVDNKSVNLLGDLIARVIDKFEFMNIFADRLDVSGINTELNKVVKDVNRGVGYED